MRRTDLKTSTFVEFAARSDGAGSGKQKQTMNYYTDDSPGVKISPVRV